MTTETPKNEQSGIKIQKLRHALDRLRNIRSGNRQPETQKKSWLERLKARLGLGSKDDAEPEEETNSTE